MVWTLGLFAAVVVGLAMAWVLLVPLTDWVATHDVGQVTGPLRTVRLQTARDAARGRLLTLGAGLFAAGALIFTARNYILSRRTFDLTEQGQVTDRYTKAIAQLGDDKLDVRIGGIYALKRIASDSVRDYPTVMDVLAAFIREHSHEQWPPELSDEAAATFIHEHLGDERTPEEDEALAEFIRKESHGQWPLAQPGHYAPERATRPDVQAAATILGRRGSEYDTHPIHLSGADLTRADLTHAHLGHADLIFADLTLANLRHADLSNANLYRAKLTAAKAPDLSIKDLDKIMPIEPDFASAPKFTGAKLFEANLIHAFLFGADFTEASLIAAKLIRARLMRSNFTHADLNRADLTHAHLNSAILVTACLEEANLTDANLTDANLTGANLRLADLRNADLRGADLRNANLRSADLRRAAWRDADFTGADLTGADVSQNAALPRGWVRDPKSGRLKPANEESAEDVVPVVRPGEPG